VISTTREEPGRTSLTLRDIFGTCKIDRARPKRGRLKMVVWGRIETLAIKSNPISRCFGASCMPPCFTTTYILHHRSLAVDIACRRKKPLEIVKKKCTCAVGLARTWYCRRWKCTTVPAVRTTTPSLKGTRTRGCQQRAASTSLEGLVGPSTGAAVTVKRRTEHSVFDISLSADILRHSVS
jgi:hypothetical protein